MENKDENINLEAEVPDETTAETTVKATTEAPRAKKEKFVVTAEMKADPISRKLILFSMFFASLALACIGFLTKTYLNKKNAAHKAPVAEVHNALAPVISQAIDQIHVVLKTEQDLRIEIVTECSDVDTCEYIKTHQIQIRDLLIPILSNVDPVTFASIEVKNVVRKMITDRLNTLEVSGKIIQIHFNNVSIEGNPK